MVVGAFYVSGIDTIYPNVSVNGVDVGGMTLREAELVLAGTGSIPGADACVTVELPLGCSFSVTGKDAGLVSNGSSGAAAAYNYCHDGGMFRCLTTYLKCLISGKELEGAETGAVDEQAVRGIINAAVEECDALLMNTDIVIGENEITILKGTGSIFLDADEIYSLVAAALLSGSEDSIVYSPEAGNADIDLQALYDQIFREPVDAVFDADSGTALASENGVSFDLEQAQRLWDEAQPGETIIIPLIVTEPEVRTEDLSASLFADCLAQKSTPLSGSSAARINNITKAAASINGVVLNPGEEFSYNLALGQRTAEAGYQGAGAYSNGQVVTEIGGGICQVSSTLYYCALYSNLKITARTCHYFAVSYLPAGLDAAVSWTSPDLKFVNDRNYPIRIESYVDMNSYTVTVKIWGTDEDGSYVEMQINTWATDHSTGATAYRLVYDADGNLLSKTKESESEYHYHTEDEEPSPSPSPSPSPEPTETPTEPTETPTDAPSAPPTETPTETPAPTEPAGPTEPIAPVDPITPIDPVDPIVPVEP